MSILQFSRDRLKGGFVQGGVWYLVKGLPPPTRLQFESVSSLPVNWVLIGLLLKSKLIGMPEADLKCGGVGGREPPPNTNPLFDKPPLGQLESISKHMHIGVTSDPVDIVENCGQTVLSSKCGLGGRAPEGGVRHCNVLHSQIMARRA